jgi:predicted Holliday junction resolvase-like endonuclease
MQFTNLTSVFIISQIVIFFSSFLHIILRLISSYHIDMTRTKRTAKRNLTTTSDEEEGEEEEEEMSEAEDRKERERDKQADALNMMYLLTLS